MRRRLSMMLAAAVAAAAILWSGCDDGDNPFEPDTLAREQVAGFYNLARLTFDPQGNALDEVDVLGRFDPADRPQLNLVRTEDTFQLIFQDPATGKFEVANGPYTLLSDGVRLEFPSDSLAKRILLPSPIDLAFDSVANTLAFKGTVDVPLERLRELVPEFENEPLSDPVPGQLAATFVRAIE